MANLKLAKLPDRTPTRIIITVNADLNQALFDNLDMIFQGLTNLRPKRLMTLLRACRSIKVKRLFFVFADRHAHAWVKHLDKSAVDFGSGPRALVKAGKLHPGLPDLCTRGAFACGHGRGYESCVNAMSSRFAC